MLPAPRRCTLVQAAYVHAAQFPKCHDDELINSVVLQCSRLQLWAFVLFVFSLYLSGW